MGQSVILLGAGIGYRTQPRIHRSRANGVGAWNDVLVRQETLVKRPVRRKVGVGLGDPAGTTPGVGFGGGAVDFACAGVPRNPVTAPPVARGPPNDSRLKTNHLWNRRNRSSGRLRATSTWISWGDARHGRAPARSTGVRAASLR